VIERGQMNTPPAPFPSQRIDRDSVYTDGDLRLMLNLSTAATAKARRLGRLRFARQGRQVLYRGQWVLDWLDREAGEVER